MSREAPVRVLTIAGSDPSGGAGIQADIKTITALGGYAMAAITALTVQNTLGVTAVEDVSAQSVKDQIQACLSDIGADAIKIGMLANGEIAAAVADVVEAYPDIPLVLDPVLVATSGRRLLDDAGVDVIRSRLIARATIVTPNLPEAAMIFGAEPDPAAFATFGASAVLLTGGHGAGDVVTDRLWTAEGGIVSFRSDRVKTRHTHGTGCTLASALACFLGRGTDLRTAVGEARDYVRDAIRTAPGFGAGAGPLNHLHPLQGNS